jgi:hypothetical protein
MLALIVMIPVVVAIVVATLVTVYRDGYGRIRS